MKIRLAALLAFAIVLGFEETAPAQDLGDLFRKVTPSGVMIEADGKVMTAAHVVNAMDEITVEAVGGESVSARVIASEPAADLSLLKVDRVPSSMRAATMAD